MKNSQDVELLKAQWLADPCWDLETTEGFEEHREELLVFRTEHEADWERKEYERLRERAQQLRCSIELVRYLEVLEASRTCMQQELEDLRRGR